MRVLVDVFIAWLAYPFVALPLYAWWVEREARARRICDRNLRDGWIRLQREISR